MTMCSVEGCGGIVLARSFCIKHYQRWKRHGDPLTVLQDQAEHAEHGAPQKFIEMALSYQDKEVCLYWPFANDRDGYAIHDIGTAKSTFVHRRICEVVKGPPPSPKHQAAHSCGKGHLGCINPHHLGWKTPRENSEEREIHGTTARGERHGYAKLTWEKVREIRALQGKLSGPEVAVKFGVTKTNIYDIWNGKIWRE